MALVETNPPKKYMYAYPRGIATSEITRVLIKPSSRAVNPSCVFPGRAAYVTRYDRKWIEPISNSKNDTIEKKRKFLRLWESEGFDPNSI